MNKNIRFGVAGLGFGANVHVPVLKSLAGVEVVAIAGTDKKKAQKIASKFGVKLGCGSIDELLKQDIDAVSIALPPDQSTKAICKAIKMGLPVLTEKPLANSFKFAKKLVQMAEGHIAMVDFQFPELESFQKIKKIIHSKKYGNVRYVQITWLVESYAHRYKIWSWKTDASRSGGVTAILGSHLLYLIEWFFGPIHRVFSLMQSKITSDFTPKNRIAADDLVNAIFDLGAIQISATIGNAVHGAIGHRWEIVFDKATVILHNPTTDYMSGFCMILKTDAGEKVLLKPKVTKFKDGRFEAFWSIARRFIHAINSGRKIKPDFADGARIQYLMGKMYLSAKKNRFIDC